jgi:hypothetical protein
MINTKKLAKIVGAGRVLDDSGTLDGFAKDHSFAGPIKPRAVVKPKKNKEIKKLVKLANADGMSLIPVSSGPPRFRGDTVPAEEGAVIVDLSGMKRIEWVNRRNRVCVIQPGVTFGELEPALEKEGMRGLMPLCPKPGKSVIASHWEREPLTLPRFQWDAMDPITTTELITGEGRSVYAGEVGSLRGSKESQRKRGHSHKHPFGVWNLNVKKIGGSSQGSMGIVPWAAVRCELLPEVEEMFFVSGDELGPLAEAAHQLLYLRLADDIYVLNSVNLACLLRKNPEEIAKLCDSLPPWSLIFTMTGYGTLPRDMFDYKKAEVESGGFNASTDLSGIDAKEVHGLLRKPSEEPYWKLRLKGDARELFFQTATRKTPAFVAIMDKLIAETGFPASDLGVYVQPERQGTCCHLEFDFYFPPDDRAQAEKVKALIDRASRELFKNGAFFSRPYGEVADLVYSHYGKTAKILNDLKGVFDPRGVMTPGRLYFKGE